MGAQSPSEGELQRRVRQQEAVAELGQRALSSDDLDGLVDEAAAAVADGLDAEYAVVLELLSGADQARLRGGVGWRDGLVGSATIQLDRDPQATDPLRSEEPVVVEDLRDEERFAGSEFLTGHDVVSGISVVVGSVADPWGVLGAYSSERRAFTEHDAAFLESVASVLASGVENAERERELETYQTIFETVDDGIYVKDENGYFTMVNDAYAALTGYSRSELVGAHASLVVDEATIEASKRRREAVDATGDGVTTMEADVLTADGDRVPTEGTFATLRTADGEDRQVGVVRDISDRKRHERELEKSEQRYRTLVEHFPNGAVTFVDEALRYRTVGGTTVNVVDETASEVEGQHVGDVLPAELADALVPRYEAALDGEASAFDMEVDGWFYQFQFAPLRDRDGDVFGALGMSQDVTERETAKRDLEESERRYRTLVEHFPNGAVGLYDEDLVYTAVGGQLMRAEDVEPEDRVGMSIFELYPDDVVEEVEPYLRRALDGTADSFEIEYLGRDLYNQVLPVRDASDEIVAGMLVVQDVTERKEYERKLEESNERLEQFAYAASHDLQEPLRMVSSYLQLVERRYADDLDEDGREFIDFAVDGADRMRKMIDALLQYSRVETRGDPFEPVDLEAVLADVRQDLQVKIEETDAEITAGTLPRVHGDERQLTQVLQNLLSNAIEYSGDDPPVVHVDAERTDRGDRWVVSVRDDGVGIDPDDQARIFEVFQSLHGTGEGGTGIGLALCERIVERHGGRIWVDSEPGAGATFSFTLPAAGPAETDD